MRIGIAINKAWNIYNFRRGIIKALIERGHEVVAIAPADDYVGRLKDLGCDFVDYPISDTGSNPFREMDAVVRLRRILKDSKIDFLLTYTIKVNIYGTIAARLESIPIICNVSGLGTAFLAKTISARVAKLMSSLVLRHSSHLFFQNQDDQNDFLTAAGINPAKSSLIPGSGIDLEEFAFEEMHLPAKFQFLMLSRLIIEKGVVEYGEAARIVKEKYPEVRFALVGGFDPNHSRSIERQELDKWEEEGLIDYFPHSDDVQTIIKEAEVIVLPSYREGTPRVLLEGAAVGRPLITTDVPGCREVVATGENGFLCKVKDGNSLAEQCIRYLELTEEQKRAMGRKSRELVEARFDEQIVIMAYMEKIDALA